MKKLCVLVLMLMGCGNPVEPEYEIGLIVNREGNIEQHEGITIITWNPINENQVDNYSCFVSYWSPYGIPGWREANLGLDLSSGLFSTDMIIRAVNFSITINNNENDSEWLSEGHPIW